MNDKEISYDKSFNKILNHTNVTKKVVNKITKNNNDFTISDIGTFNKSQNLPLSPKKTVAKKESIIQNFNSNINNFWRFILFKLSIDKKKNTFEYYHKFRVKLLSEEHLIRNHLNIYELLRLHKKKLECKRRYSYQLKDLFKLI